MNSDIGTFTDPNTKKTITIPKVSVLTITQYSRRFSFRLLVKMIEEQTMKPTEWIIVEGSRTEKQCIQNKTQIKKAVEHLSESMPKMKIVYLPNLKNNFAHMLNMGNNSCNGDIILQMEDDDYYPPTRIEHVVNKLLENPDVEVAGCSGVLIYDLKNKKAFKSPYFLDNHSCNHALAYKKSYLLKNKYNHNKERKFTVEPSFLNNYRNKMVQLDPKHTIVNIWHNNNTIDRTPILKQWNENNCCNPITQEQLDSLFPRLEWYIKQYEKIQNMCNPIKKHSA